MPRPWREGAERVSGSWWDDWVAWAAERSGELVGPPRVPPGDPAPGSYAKGEEWSSLQGPILGTPIAACSEVAQSAKNR